MMESTYASIIQTIRKFNRFYTNTLGLLNQHMLDSEFSLAEARILYDLGHTENCTAKKLIEGLRLDPGYLSRIIKRFEKLGLLYRVQSQEDGRSYYLYLTDKGKDMLAQLDARSNAQIHQMMSSLSEKDHLRVAESMKTIENTLAGKSRDQEKDIRIRYDLRPGDVGNLIQLHGWIYAEECGYNHVFEAYVCKTFFDFLLNYSPQKDRIWVAEADGQMIGAIAVVGHTTTRAQLRWFILHPDYRNRGLGKTLLGESILFCKEKGYQQIFLETTEEQKKAIAMYRKAGFKKVAAHENNTWGKALFEETYELNLL
jgi:DNA-binding MarR family transcriptional regulator/GNAT superfamily N-acetyltransferase